MATKKNNKKAMDLNIAAAMEQAVSMGVLEANTSLECVSVPAPEHTDAAPFDEVLDRMILEASVVSTPISEQEQEPEDLSFEKMRKKVSNVRKDDRCLFDQFIGGHLKVTGENAPKPKAALATVALQGGYRIVGNSIKEIRQKVAEYVKDHGAPKRAILEGNSFVLNSRTLDLATSERSIDISKSGGIIGKKYINFTEVIEGHKVSFAIQPELQPMVSILLMYTA